MGPLGVTQAVQVSRKAIDKLQHDSRCTVPARSRSSSAAPLPALAEVSFRSREPRPALAVEPPGGSRLGETNPARQARLRFWAGITAGKGADRPARHELAVAGLGGWTTYLQPAPSDAAAYGADRSGAFPYASALHPVWRKVR